MSDFKVIAEIGVNHEGSLEKAIEITKLAAEGGADVVKYQSYSPARFIARHDEARFARVTRFGLSKEDHKVLYDLTRSLGVTFLSTPVTEDWVDELNQYCSFFKIASGDITFKPVIQKVAQTGKPFIISTGAATVDEIDQAVDWVRKEVGDDKLKERLTLMHCVAAYPTPIEEANILSVPFLRERYGLKTGYSNHVIGINACLAAVALGAEVIEVHFTDQKEGREFRDHSLSFEKTDLQDFIARARDIRKSLGVYEKKPMPCEAGNIPAMRKGVVAARNLKSGHVLTANDLMYARPATEHASGELDSLIGKTIREDVAEGHLLPRKAV